MRDRSRLLPRMGWTVALLFGTLLVGGVIFIRNITEEQIKRSSIILKAAHSLPAFSIIGPDDVVESIQNPRPIDAVSKLPKNEMIVSVSTLQVGGTILRSQVVSLGVRTNVDLLAVSTSTAVVAQPGDEILLIGVHEQDKGEELGWAIFLGKVNDQIVVALCHDTALLAAPFNTRKHRLMVVRRLTAGRSELERRASKQKVPQPSPPWPPCDSNAQSASY